MSWIKTDEKEIWSGYRKLIRKYFTKPDGSAANFEIAREGEVVCVLAMTADKKVIVTQEFRPGPEKDLYELPGGFIDHDEKPEVAAKRELMEETGYTGEFIFVGTNFTDAYTEMVRYNFVALNCTKVREQQLGKHEHIQVMEMSLITFRNFLRSGQSTDITTGYLGLDYLGLLANDSTSA